MVWWEEAVSCWPSPEWQSLHQYVTSTSTVSVAVVLAPVTARRVSKTPRPSATGVFIDEPEAARRSPSPARNPVNKVIHLRNLVRPYTILQLQELLRRSGTLVDGGFWIDKVKSHCFVTVSTAVMNLM